MDYTCAYIRIFFHILSACFIGEIGISSLQLYLFSVLLCSSSCCLFTSFLPFPLFLFCLSASLSVFASISLMLSHTHLRSPFTLFVASPPRCLSLTLALSLSVSFCPTSAVVPQGPQHLHTYQNKWQAYPNELFNRLAVPSVTYVIHGPLHANISLSHKPLLTFLFVCVRQRGRGRDD